MSLLRLLCSVGSCNVYVCVHYTNMQLSAYSVFKDILLDKYLREDFIPNAGKLLNDFYVIIYTFGRGLSNIVGNVWIDWVSALFL